MIVILDYDMGNVCSIQNMLKKIRAEAIISRDPSAIEQADKLILPGVGKFDAGMEQLAHFDLVRQIRRHAVERGKPLLGICLGMQLLGGSSEEGERPGLALIPFQSLRFNLPDSNLKVPHMGWDYVKIKLGDDPIVHGLSAAERYYFVHSYHAVCQHPEEHVLMTCEYGYEFTAAVKRGNIYGVQFHPEKSHKYGMKLLENFAFRV